MSDTVITVENLSKAYLLGRKEKQDTLFGSIATAVKSPLHNLRQLRRLNTFHLSKKEEESDDILWALRDVSFEVKRGEVLGIIGRNGAGKSTLLKILSRIADPTRGRAEIRGRVSALLEVGTGFHPELSGRENVYLNGTILGMKKKEIDAKFDEIVDFSGVEKFLDTPVKRYSSGMKVRLAFAVAAHLEPEILIIDEVLAVGDAEFQKKCLGKMQDVATGEGRTVLFVSHNMAAVKRLCSSGCFLDNGSVRLLGSIDEAVGGYESQIGQEELRGEVDLPYNASRTMSIQRVELRARDVPAGRILMGDRVELIVDWHANHPVREPKVGYVISAATGEKILSANNRYQDCETQQNSAHSGRVICSLGVLPLMVGTYTLSVFLGDDAEDQHIEKDLLIFSVDPADIWGRGIPNASSSSLWWPTTFRALTK